MQRPTANSGSGGRAIPAHGAARAQVTDPNVLIPVTPPAAYAAAPYGARYYPGVGFRYVLPPSERVYGYYAGPGVYGYRVRYRPCARRTWWWDGARCGRLRDRW